MLLERGAIIWYNGIRQQIRGNQMCDLADYDRVHEEFIDAFKSIFEVE